MFISLDRIDEQIGVYVGRNLMCTDLTSMLQHVKERNFGYCPRIGMPFYGTEAIELDDLFESEIRTLLNADKKDVALEKYQERCIVDATAIISVGMAMQNPLTINCDISLENEDYENSPWETFFYASKLKIKKVFRDRWQSDCPIIGVSFVNENGFEGVASGHCFVEWISNEKLFFLKISI